MSESEAGNCRTSISDRSCRGQADPTEGLLAAHYGSAKVVLLAGSLCHQAADPGLLPSAKRGHRARSSARVGWGLQGAQADVRFEVFGGVASLALFQKILRYGVPSQAFVFEQRLCESMRECGCAGNSIGLTGDEDEIRTFWPIDCLEPHEPTP